MLFVRLAPGETLTDALEDRIRAQIRANASPHHVPKKIIQVADIPRTISGKITELAVRDVIHGRPVKNADALANPEALELFRNLPELATSARARLAIGLSGTRRIERQRFWHAARCDACSRLDRRH